MTLEQLLMAITKSSASDWYREACWGANSGPSYRYQVDDESNDLINVKSHPDIAVYRHDVSITIAWGLDRSADFKAEWANKWTDPDASSSFVDVFYNNALVYRDIYVSVDGARAWLPIPDRVMDAKKEKVVALTVPRGRHNLIRLIDSICRVSSFDEYFDGAGFTVVDEEWP